MFGFFAFAVGDVIAPARAVAVALAGSADGVAVSMAAARATAHTPGRAHLRIARQARARTLSRWGRCP